MSHPQRILVFRFSALGDVAMTAPVLLELLQEYPDIEITFVSKEFHRPFFEGMSGVEFYGVNLDNYKGLFGLRKLAKEISSLHDFDAIVDLHNVLRTTIIKFFLPTSGVQVATIGKGRTAKRKLTRKKNKQLKPLKLMVQRYADCFAEVGLEFELHNELKRNVQPLNAKLLSVLGQKRSNWIGIAPFARHKPKRMPIEKAEKVIEQLSSLPNVKIMLFGGGKLEERKLQNIADDYSNVYNIAGKLALGDELDLISHLDVMVSMDSANMHMASLMGVPVVSIWGGTHPYLGFLGYGQSMADTVQTDLYCRPCSVFGNKACYRGDHACLYRIDEEEILIKVSKFLTQTN